MIYSIITGDIVNFTKLDITERNQVINLLKAIFGKIKKTDGDIVSLKKNYEIFRGDSFQLIVKDKLQSLKYCILIRAGLRSLFIKHTQDLCDARLAVGFGKVDYIGKTLSESDGEAFRNSGRELDKIGTKRKIVIKTDEVEINQELEVELSLLDAIVNNWSHFQSSAVYEKIIEQKQGIIAEKLGISEGGVSLRLSSASWYSIELLLSRYEELLKKRGNGIN